MISSTFLLAGKAVFTVSNDKSEHYTYKVNKAANSNRYFVKLRTSEDYTYIGMIVGEGTALKAITTKASRMSNDSKAMKVFNWAIKQILEEATLPDGYEIQHEGQCGACGKALTNPHSIEVGLGPICEGK